ncbi:hypothetical protein BGW80DRAFT_1465044 [Lactifluus volemus]|nr:hypothetical protein BGW80DRAFT_1465044 [Lactifluus volemus]
MPKCGGKAKTIEHKQLEQWAWVRLAELAVFDCTTSFGLRAQTDWGMISHTPTFATSLSDLSTLAARHTMGRLFALGLLPPLSISPSIPLRRCLPRPNTSHRCLLRVPSFSAPASASFSASLSASLSGSGSGSCSGSASSRRHAPPVPAPPPPLLFPLGFTASVRQSTLSRCLRRRPVCALLDNWSCIDLPRALSYIQRYRTYEGGYGQTPLCESLGGPTYCALASMHLVPAEHPCVSQTPQMQTEAKLGGSFAGQMNKLADACYGFWCDAALAICPFPFRFLAAQSTHNTPNMPATPFLFFFSHLLTFAPRCPERLSACTLDREDQETRLTLLGSFAVCNVREAVTHIAGQMFVRAVLGADSQSRNSDIYDTNKALVEPESSPYVPSVDNGLVEVAVDQVDGNEDQPDPAGSKWDLCTKCTFVREVKN